MEKIFDYIMDFLKTSRENIFGTSWDIYKYGLFINYYTNITPLADGN